MTKVHKIHAGFRYDGSFIRRERPFFVYIFTTESPLIVMDDAPAEVEVGGQRFAGQIISVQGSEVAVGIEHELIKHLNVGARYVNRQRKRMIMQVFPKRMLRELKCCLIKF